VLWPHPQKTDCSLCTSLQKKSAHCGGKHWPQNTRNQSRVTQDDPFHGHLPARDCSACDQAMIRRVG